MFYRKIIADRSKIHIKHINDSAKRGFFKILNLVVHKVITWLKSANIHL